MGTLRLILAFLRVLVGGRAALAARAALEDAGVKAIDAIVLRWPK